MESKEESRAEGKKFKHSTPKNHEDENFKKDVKRSKKDLKKKKSKAPVELSNNEAVNPYRASKLLSKGVPKKLVARDPRFSDLSGKLNMDMFQRSYDFLEYMREEEVKEITTAIKVNKKHGSDSLEGVNAMRKISHLDISTLEEAKRCLDRYKSEKAQLEKSKEMRELKKKLVEEEKEKIEATGKKPYYFPEKKVKSIYKDMQRRKMEESMKSTAINYGPDKKIHKKLESESRRKLPKERKLDAIPKFRDV